MGEITSDAETPSASTNSIIKVVLVILSITIIWKVISLNIAQLYEQQLLERSDVVDASLAWSPDQPGVLFRAAQDTDNTNTEKTGQLLMQSLRGNPADGRVLVTLGKFWLGQNKIDLADKAVHQAMQNLPSDPYTHIEAGSYWLQRNNLKEAITSWNIALQTTPELKSGLFPLFLNWIEEGKLGSSLSVVTRQPPIWWEAFFDYAADNSSRIETLDVLYNLRRQSPVALSENERTIYVNRLKKAGLWSEAFLAWLNGLGPDGLKYMGQPYNGNFEAPLTQSAFGWNILESPGVIVETDHTFGNKGGRALHLVFQGEQSLYKHFFQTLFLAPSQYRLSGRVRPDSLITTGGLRWRVQCISDKNNEVKDLLGESVRFLGVGQWRSFNFEFEVPTEGCKGQLLRLEAVGKNKADFILTGEIWFDSIAIERI